MPEPDVAITIDLTPSPRVLLMLGQIEFAAWQCLAESIDNGIDALTAGPGGALTTVNPTISVELPSQAQVDQAKGSVVVTDNGPGMTLDQLERAMRAGYSGNSATDKLGLFGMGFNVATARLGRLTEVRTTQLGADNWAILTIDLDRMRQENSFKAPVRFERKRDDEANVHGTRVTTSRLDAGRAKYLASGGGRASIRAKLSRVYGNLIRESGVQIVVGSGSQPLVGHRFCTWSKERVVRHEDVGPVSAIQVVDEDLGSMPFCDNCWQYLAIDGPCPTCGADGRVVQRRRRVRGWLGVQRYFDASEFGIDLLRNGRVIEPESKVFFSWRDPDTDDILPEYPLEQTHWGGRLVGELEIDFVPLASHQKDAFDKATSEWREVVRVIRGDEGPILEGKRKTLGYPEVDYGAPMVRLHRAFRRGHPAGLKTLVPGGPDGKGFNELAREWAHRFYAGDAEYETDQKWWEAVLEAEKAHEKKKGAKVPEELQGDDLLGPGPDDDDGERVSENGPARYSELVPTLSGEFIVPGLEDGVAVRLDTNRLLSGTLAGGGPLEIAFVAGRGEATYDPKHRLFGDTLIEPVDLIVPEIVYQLWQRNTLQGSGRTLGELALAVRSQLPALDTTTRREIGDAAASVVSTIRLHLRDNWSTKHALTAITVASSAIEGALGAMQAAGITVDDDPEAIAAQEQFPMLVSASGLAELVGLAPWFVYDGRLLQPDAAAVRADVQRVLGQELAAIVTDAAALESVDADGSRSELSRARFVRAIGATSLFDARRAD